VLAGGWAVRGRVSSALSEHGSHPTVRGPEVHRRPLGCTVVGTLTPVRDFTPGVYLPSGRAGGAGPLTQAQSVSAPADGQSAEHRECVDPQHGTHVERESC